MIYLRYKGLGVGKGVEKRVRDVYDIIEKSYTFVVAIGAASTARCER